MRSCIAPISNRTLAAVTDRRSGVRLKPTGRPPLSQSRHGRLSGKADAAECQVSHGWRQDFCNASTIPSRHGEATCLAVGRLLSDNSPIHPKMSVQVTPEQMAALRATLLNTSGKVELHERFRALFMLKAVGGDEVIQIIAEGECPYWRPVVLRAPFPEPASSYSVHSNARSVRGSSRCPSRASASQSQLKLIFHRTLS